MCASNDFGCLLFWISSDVVVNWFEIQMIRLSIDLRFKWFGCQSIWDSNELVVKEPNQQPRFWHPVELLLMHAFVGKHLINNNWSDAYRHIGNQICIPHALLALANVFFAYHDRAPLPSIEVIFSKLHDNMSLSAQRASPPPRLVCWLQMDSLLSLRASNLTWNHFGLRLSMSSCPWNPSGLWMDFESLWMPQLSQRFLRRQNPPCHSLFFGLCPVSSFLISTCRLIRLSHLTLWTCFGQVSWSSLRHLTVSLPCQPPLSPSAMNPQTWSWFGTRVLSLWFAPVKFNGLHKSQVISLGMFWVLSNRLSCMMPFLSVRSQINFLLGKPQQWPILLRFISVLSSPSPRMTPQPLDFTVMVLLLRCVLSWTFRNLLLILCFVPWLGGSNLISGSVSAWGGAPGGTKTSHAMQVRNALVAAMLEEGYELQWVSDTINAVVRKIGIKELSKVFHANHSAKLQIAKDAVKQCGLDLPKIQPTKVSQASFQAKKVKQPVQLNPANYRVIEGALLNEDKTPTIHATSFAGQTTGYQCMLPSEALPWLTTTENLSKDKLALLIFGNVPSACIRDVKKITLPCVDERAQQVLVSCSLLQFGDK